MIKWKHTYLSFLSLLTVVILSSYVTSNIEKSEKDNVAVLANSLQVSQSGVIEINELNDGLIPDSVSEIVRIRLSNIGNNQRASTLSVIRYEYVWEKPVSIDEIALFLYDYDGLINLPVSFNIQYWDGEHFKDVFNLSESANVKDNFDHYTFDEITTK